jgi:hypothetical protein
MTFLKPALSVMAAIAMIGSPVAAAPRSAARLSVDQSVRAGSATKANPNEIRGGSLTLILGVIAAVAGVTFLIVGGKSKSP